MSAPPTPEQLADRQAAYDAGYEQGFGIPLTAWGAATGAVGAVMWGALDHPVGGGVVLGLGAVQLAAGIVLVALGRHRGVDEKAHLAWEVGRDRGLGNALMSYGVACAVGIIYSFTVHPSDLRYGLALTAASAADLQAGFGLREIDESWRVYDRFRAPQSVTLVSLPALRF